MATLALNRIVNRNNQTKNDTLATVSIPRFFKAYSNWKFINNETYSKDKTLLLSRQMLNLANKLQIQASNELIAHHKEAYKKLEKRSELLTICSFTLSTYASVMKNNITLIVIS